MENKNSNKLMALLFVGVLMGALDISIVGPAIPSIEESLKIDNLYVGWIFSIYILLNLMGISLFARLSDIFGRRNIYVISLLIFAAGSLVVSFTNSFEMLLIGRAIQGFGASGIFPVASAIVGDIYPPDKRGKMLGIIGAVFGLAFMIGPFIAGVMLHYFSWNTLFIINVPIAALLVYFSFKIIPAKTITVQTKIDWSGIIMLGLGLGAFTFGINKIEVSNLSSVLSSKVLIPMLIAFVSFVLLLFSEKKATSPIIKFGFFRNNQIVFAGILAIVVGLIQSVFVFIPKFVVDNFQVSPSVASFMLTPFVLATAIGSPVFGRMIDKYGVKPIIISGLSFLFIGFLLLFKTGNSLILYYSSGVAIGLGLSVLSGSSLRYIMLNNTSADDRAISQGMITIFTSVGQLSGAAIVGILLAMKSNSYNILFSGLSIILIVIVFSFAFGFKNEKKSGINTDSNK
jgi:EmrB/QacA subfamily drug resistance transporter